MNKEIIDIFENLSNFLKTVESKNRADRISFAKKPELLLVNLNSVCSNSEMKVVPLIDTNRVDNATSLNSKNFERFTKPNGRVNAIAAIVVGHQSDEFESKSDDEAARIENFKKKLLPLFVNRCNEFLSKQNIDGKSLKLKIANSVFEQVNVSYRSTSIPYVTSKDEPFDVPAGNLACFCVPLALQVVFS